MQRNGATTIVRASVEADIAPITEIYAQHVLHGSASFETEAPSAKEMQSRRAGLLSRMLPYLVAEQAGRVVGYAYAGPYRPRPAYWNAVEDSVYLQPNAAGQGIGRLLLGELIARCEALGLRQMIAVVGDSGNLASIRLHEQAGFRLVGVLRSVGYKQGRWLDGVLLQRMLGDGDRTPPAAPRFPAA